jgi:putative flippase GtrA
MKRWSFEHRGDSGRTFVRYLCAYAIGYSVNLATMVVLVDRAGYPHQAVQILNAVVFAGLFFLLLKFWVFSPAGHPTNRNV